MSQVQPTVAVVMSTYNGKAFLSKQIESILSQDGVKVRLFVRDDGSTDGTVDLLRSYERKGMLALVQGENVGVAASFIAGISAVPHDVQLIALSDQDDIWHPDKLARAVACIAEKDQSVPQLYCSEYLFCDDEMRPLGRSHLNLIGVGFSTLLYETKVSGNTIVMNRTLADMAIAAGARDVYCHDWWLGLLAAAFGELTFDDFISLDYRRIRGSVSPTGANAVTLLRYRIKTFLNREELSKITAQLRRFYDAWGNRLPSEKKKLTERFLFGSRFAKAFAPVRLRQIMSEEIALRVLFLAGLL